MIGLGRMGANMALRLRRGGHRVLGLDPDAAARERAQAGGVEVAGSPAELLAGLQEAPRVLWLMLPAALVDRQIAELVPHLRAGDIVIDGGNSCHQDDIRRAAELQAAGIHYLDVGTSGGVAGLERGYCLMIGGESAIVDRLAPIFATLAPGVDAAPATPGRRRDSATEGWLHCGPHGAGHFVKMVHNGIEYGLMAAYAEGLNLLRHADAGLHQHAADAETTPLRHPEHYRYQFDLPAIAELWRRGSVIGSWLLDLTAAALAADAELAGFPDSVADSGEGRWTLAAAIDTGVPVPVLSAALYQRFSSRGNAAFADRVLSAMRQQFGGHGAPKPPGEEQ